jgi:hypothetical protein
MTRPGGVSKVRGKGQRVLAGLAVGIAALGVAPGASASISPTVTLDQSAGTSAGSSVNLGMDLKFAPSSGDSPKDLTIGLPPGLLSNASIDGGACLKTATPMAPCQVGTGTATASVLGISMPVPLTFYLIAPPKPADLAGLVTMATVLGNTSQLGSPADVTIRSSDPNDVGINIALSNVPNTFSGLSIQLNELSSTFDGLRLPTGCPNPAARVKVTADSYGDSTTQTTSAPLQVTGCANLALTPTFRVTAAKDAHDDGVEVVTDLTQPVRPIQSTSRTVKLTLPPSVLVANGFAIASHGILCANPASGTCKTIGTASSASPLYPTPLGGKVYLTGTLTAPFVTIVFPPPFALTLGGAVSSTTGVTTFQNVPDIPLTDLNVTLTSGPDAAFLASCKPASGIASSTLTSQNGDRTVTASSPFTVTGCPAAKPVRPRLVSGSLSGLARGRPVLKFRVTAGAKKLRSVRVALPSGLHIIKRRVVRASLSGARAKSLSLAGGLITVTLRTAVQAFAVRISGPGLGETAGLRNAVKHHRAKSLRLRVTVKDAAGKSTTVTLKLKNVS